MPPGKRNADVRFRASCGIWRVVFYDGHHKEVGTTSRTFRSDAPDVEFGGITWQSRNTLTFRPSTSQMFFEEKYLVKGSAEGAGFVSADVKMDKLNARVFEEFPLPNHNEDGTVSLGHSIIWKIEGGLRANTDKGPDKFRSFGPDLLKLHSDGNWLPRVKFVQFMAYDYKNMSPAKFDAQELISIIGGSLQRSLAATGDAFYREQVQALLEEDEAFDKQVEDLKRDQVTVNIATSTKYPRYPGRLVLSFTLPTSDPWGVEIGTKLRLDANSIFVDRLATKDGDGVEAWTATIVAFVESVPLATINNRTTTDQKNEMFGRTVYGVKVKVIDNDDLRDRLSRAVNEMEAAFRYERGVMTPLEAEERPRAQLQVRLSPLLLDHTDVKLTSADNRPFLLAEGLASPASVRYRPEWQLNSSNLQFLESLTRGTGGIAGLFGPPGSGKTTLLAKAVGFARLFYRMKGKIAMAAHSNHATQVILENVVEQLPKFGFDPKEEVVWVETLGAMKRRLNPHIGREVSAGVTEFTLRHKIRAIAEAEPEQWGPYIRLGGSLARGVQLSNSERNQYNRLTRELEDVVRSKCSIFICTVSTLGTGFFQKKKGGFKCSMLVLDEQSQCPMPAFLEACQVTNPYRVVIAGDPHQLTPFARSDKAKTVWGFSPITYAVRLGSTITPMLDEEFRMPGDLYYATSHTHYHGKVRAHQSTVNRPIDLDILSKLSKIEIDVDGTNKWQKLSHRLLILDIRNSPESHYPPTSKVNFGEAAVTERLVRAMNCAGIRYEDIMYLIGYQGGYQQGVKMREHLRATGLAVRKVDSSQGDEKRIVVMNTIRSSVTGGRTTMGFMAHAFRQNVFTSRQRSAFILIGDVKCMETADTWNTWLKFVREGNQGSNYYYAITQRAAFRVGKQEFTRATTPHVVGSKGSSAPRAPAGNMADRVTRIGAIHNRAPAAALQGVGDFVPAPASASQPVRPSPLGIDDSVSGPLRTDRPQAPPSIRQPRTIGSSAPKFALASADDDSFFQSFNKMSFNNVTAKEPVRRPDAAPIVPPAQAPVQAPAITSTNLSDPQAFAEIARAEAFEVESVSSEDEREEVKTRVAEEEPEAGEDHIFDMAQKAFGPNFMEEMAKRLAARSAKSDK